jgi:hypothetical protein
LSFLQILEQGNASGKARLIAVALSFLLAWLTYRLVEAPIRGGSNGRIKVGLLCMLAVVVWAAGMLFGLFEGAWRPGMLLKITSHFHPAGFPLIGTTSSPAADWMRLPGKSLMYAKATPVVLPDLPYWVTARLAR